VLLLSPTPSPIPFTSRTIIGYSVQQRPIVSYRLGTGPMPLVFIGGIHGGYEWNTIILAYEVVDYLMDNPELIPDSVTVYIIPSANPDGQFLVTGKDGRFEASDVRSNTFPGRFNANGVDLNRNWDCNWSPVAYWRQEQINSGPYPFSEPENLILREYLLAIDPAAVVFWHSAANAVFAAGCPNLYLPSRQLAQIYGRAANYPVRDEFSSYIVTGDATDWLATQNIPAITVELINHYDLDWPQNRAGVLAVLNFFDCCQLD
jgi:predicted deacylase